MTIWGLRLALHIGWRNHGKGEDYRYQQFRQDFGPERYWWFSFFQVFLLQGGLLWFISAPLLAVPYLAAEENPFGLIDALALLCWGVGFAFEAGGDWQLLEVNTVPGMTSHSLVPLAAKVAGLSLLDLLTEIYQHSLKVRHADQ